ncbi:Predicted ATPase [Mycobacterium tuberculosis]|nr:Predicted ATPase [Mycobacterium tuberculosis]
MSTDDVYALMARSQELPYGEARTVLVEDALRRAEAAGDEVLAFHVRVRLTDAYRYGGEPAKAFATFSRTLADHDRDPGRFDETHGLLWQMKAIVSSLTLFPEIPLDRTYAVLDDMERRYKAGGHSLQAVYHYRNVVARHVGDGTADDWYVKWRSAERDELSDCEGCDPTGMARHLIEAGRHEEAFEVAAPVLAAQLNCNEQPQSIQTALLPVYLRTGRAEQAADAHRRAYRVHRTRLADLADVAEHLEFCAVTGNEARGLEILQRHIGWLDRAPSAHADMEFSGAAALLLGRVAAAGHGDATIRRPGPDGRAADVPVAGLRAELAERATALAARFDARNGTSRQGDKVRATLAAEPVAEFVPLAAHHRRPAPQAAVPEPAPAPEQDDLAAVGDLDELLDIGDRCRQSSDVPGMLAAWRRFDTVAGTTEPTPLQRARRLDARGVEHAVDGDGEQAAAAWDEASRLFGELGDETRRHRTLGRLGAVRIDLGDEDGFDLLAAAAGHFTANPGDAADTASALLRLATGHIRFDRPGEALAVLDGVPEDASDYAGELWFLRGQALLLTDRGDDAAAALRRSVEAARASADPELVASPALLLARTLARRESGPDDEVFALLDEVIGAVPGASPMRAAAHSERGLAFLAVDRPADAVADLVEGIAAWTAAGLHPQAVELRVDLAAAYLSTDRALEAAETAEEALPNLDGDNARRCRLILAHAQKQLGEEEAAALFTGLAEDAAREGQHDAVAHFLNEAADVLTALDMDAQAAERYAQAAEAYEKTGDPYGVVRTRRRAAMCLMWSGDGDGAVTAMETARAALAGLPPDNEPARVWETALTSFEQARVLAQAGRLAEAASHASAAVDGFTAIDQPEPAENATRLLEDIRAGLD